MPDNTVMLLAPNERTTWVHNVQPTSFQPVIDLNVPPVTRWVRSGDCFIFVSKFDPSVHFFDLRSNVSWSIALPSRAQPFDLAIWQNSLFVAGGGSDILACSLNATSLDWQRIECRKEDRSCCCF